MTAPWRSSGASVDERRCDREWPHDVPGIWRRLHSDTAPPAGAPAQPAAKPPAAPAPSATAPSATTAQSRRSSRELLRKCLPAQSPAVAKPPRRPPVAPSVASVPAAQPGSRQQAIGHGDAPTVSVPRPQPPATAARVPAPTAPAGDVTPIDEYASKSKTVFREVWRRIHQEDAVIAGKPEDRKELGALIRPDAGKGATRPVAAVPAPRCLSRLHPR